MQAAEDQGEIISTFLAEYEKTTTRRAWQEQFKVSRSVLSPQLRDKHSLWSLQTEPVRNHAANTKTGAKEQV